MLQFTKSTITITANSSSDMVANLLKAESNEMIAVNSNTEYSLEDNDVKMQISVKQESSKVVEFTASCFISNDVEKNKHCGTVVIRDGFVVPSLRLDISIDDAERITRLARQAYEEVIA